MQSKTKIRAEKVNKKSSSKNSCMLITQADCHNGRGTQSTSAITGKFTNRVEQQLLVKQVSKDLHFSRKIQILYGRILLCNKERAEFRNRIKNKVFGNAVDRWSKKISKRETLGLLLTSNTRYRSGHSSASSKKWELRQQGRLTSQYRLENKCY